MIKKILLFLIRFIANETGTTLAVTNSFSPNTLISSSEMNENFDDVEAVVNALTSTNYADDSVGAAALNSDVVRTDYGLIQHTDGSLYVDVSDTNPCLELSDGGLRVKVDDSSIERASGGLQVKANGVTSAMLEDDLVFGTFPLTPSAAPDADYEVSNKKYVDDQITANATSSEQIIKGWINMTGTGTIAINDSYNVDSITDNGTGDYTVTWDTDFASVNYAVAGVVKRDSAAAGPMLLSPANVASNPAVGTIRIHTDDLNGSNADPELAMLIAIGDQ